MQPEVKALQRVFSLHNALRIGVLLFAVLIVMRSVHAEATNDHNIVQGLAYTLSPQPNYAGASDTQELLLTDGDLANGRFWSNKTAVGWSWKTRVTATLELPGTAAVTSVHVQAGAKRSGEAYFPSQILVYGRAQSNQYSFLGESELQSDNQSPEASTLQMFEIKFAPRNVKEILIVVIARGAFTWLGEIEVRAGVPVSSQVFSDQKYIEALDADILSRRRNAISSLASTKPQGPTKWQRWAMPLTGTQPVTDAASGCSVNRTEPWPDDPQQELAIAADAPIVFLAGGNNYAAFRVVNQTGMPASVSVSDGAEGEQKRQAFALAYVQALDYTWVRDVVTPFENGYLPAESSMVLLVKFHELESDHSAINFSIFCGTDETVFAMPVTKILPDETVKQIDGNLWTYVHSDKHLPVASAIGCESDFLTQYGISMVVIHPNALLDDGGRRPTELLSTYMQAYRNAPFILLGMDVKTRPWVFKTMNDSQAQASLSDWWGWVQEVAEAQGVQGELILYPIDEPKTSDVSLLLRTIDLLRVSGVEARSYSTVEKKTAIRLRSLDIIQFLRPSVLWRFVFRNSELHSYNTRFDGKLLSNNSYYRLQGWRAFDLGLSGVGVWSAWDSSGLADPDTGWNPFNGKRERDFGLIYVSPNGCAWPSRRLLAWRRGIEENRALRSCSNSIGESVVSKKVQQVVTSELASNTRGVLAEVAALCLN